MDILRERLRNQGLLTPEPAGAGEVVRRLTAVQAQDYLGARWAVAQRAAGLDGAAVDEALGSGTIVRTHVLRPTWHLVHSGDIRWLLQVTTPRVRALAAYGDRESGIDERTFARSARVLATALRDGRQLTRAEVAAAWRDGGVEPGDTVRAGRLLLRAELDGLVCSGALRGRQHTYALLDDRVPPSAPRDREEALADLAGRYCAGHGPATARDLAWWSGLTVTDATIGLRAARPRLETVDVGGQEHWRIAGVPTSAKAPSPRAHLLPSFDEYTVAYTDRRLLLEDAYTRRHGVRSDVVLGNVVLVDGVVVGTWKRVLARSSVLVTVTAFRRLRRTELSSVRAAADRFSRFLGLALELEVQPPPG